MSADTDKLLHDAAARPSRDLDLAALNGRRLRRRNRRRALGSIAAVAVLAVGVLTFTDLIDGPQVDFAPAEQQPDASEPQRLPAPEGDGVSAERLPDGTPVFVTRLDDDIHVLDARAPHHLEQGLEVYVSFCEDPLVAGEPWSGSMYDRAGFYQVGPAPGGLVSYEVTVEPTDGGETLLVGQRRAAPARDAEFDYEQPVPVVDCAWAIHDDRAVHHFTDATADALTPEEAAATDHPDPVLVFGSVQRIADERRACSDDPADLPAGESVQIPVCPADAPQVAPAPFAFLDDDDQWSGTQVYGAQGLYLMTSEQGRLHVVGVTPVLHEYHTPGEEDTEGEQDYGLSPPPHDGTEDVTLPPMGDIADLTMSCAEVAVYAEFKLGELQSLPTGLAGPYCFIEGHFHTGALPAGENDDTEPWSAVVMYVPEGMSLAESTYFELMNSGAVSVTHTPLERITRPPGAGDASHPAGGWRTVDIDGQRGVVHRETPRRSRAGWQDSIRSRNGRSVLAVDVRAHREPEEVVGMARQVRAGMRKN